ncbi:rCG50559, partial [Rattus norvegicus]
MRYSDLKCICFPEA